MFLHGDIIKYTGYVFVLTCMMSSVYSLVVPSSDDSKLHTMTYPHKSTLHPTVLPEKNIKHTQVLLESIRLGNVLAWLLGSSEQDEVPLTPDKEKTTSLDYMKITDPIPTQWRKIFSRIFNFSKNRVETLKRIKRNVPMSHLPTEKTYLFNDSRLKVLVNSSNNISDTDRFHILQLSQTRLHRGIVSDSSNEHISDHRLKSHLDSIQENTWTNANITFYKELIRKLVQEREVKHSAQVAFLCLSGLFSLMTWVIWYNGMCRNRSSKYMYWDHKETATTDLRDIFYRRGKYLPMFQDKEYGVVYVKDTGTNP